MDTVQGPAASVANLLMRLDGLAVNFSHRPDRRKEAEKVLHEITGSARDADQLDLLNAAQLLLALLDLCQCSESTHSPGSQLQQLTQFLKEGFDVLSASLNAESDASQRIDSFVQEANEEWKDYIELLELDSSTSELDGWDTAPENKPTDGATTSATDPGGNSSEQINLILSALGDAEQTTADEPESVRPPSGSHDQPRGGTAPNKQSDPFPSLEKSFSPDGHPSDPSLVETVELDPELAEAYLDDATRCVASIEQSVLDLESNPAQAGAAQQICRELHTLKGASASVGLERLSRYLHEIEDSLKASCDAGSPVTNVEAILQAVDIMRKQMALLSPGGSQNDATAGDNSQPSSVVAAPSSLDESVLSSDESLRVKASKLDRLMDMLAELVMLRNRRDSRVAELKQIHGDLIGCVSRMRTLGQHSTDTRLSQSLPMPGSLTQAHQKQDLKYLAEIASDVLETARHLRDFYEPTAEENHTISRFIRQFRQQLVELRRLPVAGLFRRLQRSVRDAARSEGKNVRVQIVGGDTGVERSLQERLYEPLLHIVRNAVSHGIEDESERTAAGKDPCGTLILEARDGPNAFLVEVRDDGKGLDYEALRQRGLQRGLLNADDLASREELAKLIFHPGFSTRDTTTEISGRGVGMDVVSTTIERMRGWIEVRSEPGQGTVIRLIIPLRSTIDHAMVFRAGQQLFALPMQFVHSVGEETAGDKTQQLHGGDLRFTDLLSLPQSTHSAGQTLVVGVGGQPAAGDASSLVGNVTLTVDELIGPEEVVVRPLPTLLRHQRLFSGVALSGNGDIVLVLDCPQLTELSGAFAENQSSLRSAAANSTDDNAGAEQILVVDDSLSARKTVAQAVRRLGYAAVEASDGMEAIEHLINEKFMVVFTDLEMPRMDGMELLKQIKQRKQTASLPVVMITSRTDQRARQTARQLGVYTFMTKPANDIAIQKAIEAIRSNNNAFTD